MNDVSVSIQASEALRIMFNGIKCIDHRIDLKLEEQQHAIDEGCGIVEENAEQKEECLYHISPQMLWIVKLKKRTLQKGALVFNQSAKEGIKYLQEAKLIPDPASPGDIAHFLRFTPGLDKEQIGEYLGKNTEENKQTLYEYVRTFDFRNISLLTALRMFLDTFRLPGEAQQIDRIMETFAQWAYEQTTEHDLLINPDVTYCVCFSIIMLNTDLHNPNMKPERRMQLKDFIKLNKSYGDMNKGRELTEEFLVGVYKSIASEQIFTSSAATNDQLRNEQWVNVMRQTHTQSQQFIGHSSMFFENCKECNAGMYDRDIFSILWGPQLAAAGALLEIVKEHRLLEFALDSFVTLAHIGAYFNMTSVLDSLVYFLSKFSRITSEYITDSGENDPVEFIVLLGEKASSQLSLISLLGIVRKLGNNLGKSWEEVIHALCHLYFLGLFPVSQFAHHQYQLLSENERVDLTAMVDGLVEERFSTRKGLLSRLFAWSPEEDDVEKNIQLAPIDPSMWLDLKKRMSLPMPHHRRSVIHEEQSSEEDGEEEDEEEEDGEEEDEEEEDGEEDGEESEGVYSYGSDSEYSDESYSDDSNDKQQLGPTPSTKVNSISKPHKIPISVTTTNPIITPTNSPFDDDLSDSDSTPNPYELTLHEVKCIENVLECIEKCRLDLFFASSVEWSNNSLLMVIQAAIHLAKQPYRMFFFFLLI